MTPDRKQHYVFAHQALPEIFFRDPGALIDSLEKDGETILGYLWRQVGDYLGEHDQEAAKELAVEVVNQQNPMIGMVTCPTPRQTTEVYFIALAYRPDQGHVKGLSRYFTLEYSLTFGEDPRPATVFCEWDHAIHRNYGDGPEPDRQAFLEVVHNKLESSDDNPR